MNPAEYKIVIDHMYVIVTKLVVAEKIEEHVINKMVHPYGEHGLCRIKFSFYFFYGEQLKQNP